MQFFKKLFRFVAKSLFFLLVAVTMFAASLYVYLNPSAPESQAFINGTVLTLDKGNSIAEAVYLENGRIVAVGTDHNIKKYIQAETNVVDLSGKTLMPGFIDAHGHFPGSGLAAVAVDLNSPPIGSVKNIEGALQLLKEKADATPEGKWVVGFGYDDTSLPEKRHFTLQELDKVSTKHPVYVIHISGHMGVGNSVAMERGGITLNTPNPVGGEIVKDEAGKLTGLLLETAHKPVVKNALKFPLLDRLKITIAATDDYLSKGVTTAQNGLAAEEHINGLWQASKLGLIPLRLIVWPDEQVGRKVLAKELDYSQRKSDRFNVGAVKLVADGSIQGYTGFLKEPYHVHAPGMEVDYRGYPSVEKEEFIKEVKAYHKAGYQLAIHGNGDAAIDMIIDAFKQAQSEYPRTDARPIIIHSQMITDEQLEEVKELGMTPSFFAAHTYYWGDRHKSIFLGEERANRISPTKTALQNEIPFTIHMDTPIVPMDPMLMVWNASTRQSSSGDVIGADQRISIVDAIRATTIDAAWQVFQENQIGSIEVGKQADLIVLSQNPLSNLQNLRGIKVERTLVGGVTVYP